MGNGNLLFKEKALFLNTGVKVLLQQYMMCGMKMKTNGYKVKTFMTN